LKGLGISDLYKSQKDAVWLDKLNGGGIINHEVGGGKTLIMCVSAYEKKRLGLVNKPLIMALKANVHEIAQTFCTAYPKEEIKGTLDDRFAMASAGSPPKVERKEDSKGIKL